MCTTDAAFCHFKYKVPKNECEFHDILKADADWCAGDAGEIPVSIRLLKALTWTLKHLENL